MALGQGGGMPAVSKDPRGRNMEWVAQPPAQDGMRSGDERLKQQLSWASQPRAELGARGFEKGRRSPLWLINIVSLCNLGRLRAHSKSTQQFLFVPYKSYGTLAFSLENSSLGFQFGLNLSMRTDVMASTHSFTPDGKSLRTSSYSESQSLVNFESQRKPPQYEGVICRPALYRRFREPRSYLMKAMGLQQPSEKRHQLTAAASALTAMNDGSVLRCRLITDTLRTGLHIHTEILEEGKERRRTVQLPQSLVSTGTDAHTHAHRREDGKRSSALEEGASAARASGSNRAHSFCSLPGPAIKAKSSQRAGGLAAVRNSLYCLRYEGSCRGKTRPVKVLDTGYSMSGQGKNTQAGEICKGDYIKPLKFVERERRSPKGEKSSRTGKPSAGMKSSHLWMLNHSSSATLKHRFCSAFDGDRVMNLEGNRQQEATDSELPIQTEDIGLKEVGQVSKTAKIAPQIKRLSFQELWFPERDQLRVGGHLVELLKTHHSPSEHSQVYGARDRGRSKTLAVSYAGRKEMFPNIQSKPPLAQLEAISSRPITCYLGEETNTHPTTPSFQAVVESDKVSPQPPLLQAEQPQVPQPLPISLVLQTLPQLRCPSLDTLQPLNVSLVVRGPELNTAFEVSYPFQAPLEKPRRGKGGYSSWFIHVTQKQKIPPTLYSRAQNHIGWKRPLRSSSPTVNLTPPRPPLHHVPKHLIQTSFKYLQGWGLNHFPGQPVPMLDHPFSEVKFPNIQSKPPLAQLEAISSHPITCYLGEETDPTSLQPPFRQFDEVSPQPPSLQAKQPQVPQPLPISLVLQTLPQLRCPSLHTLQPLNVSLVVRGPELNTVFEVRPHQCQVQRDDHCPSPAGHTIFNTSQDAIGFLGHLGTLLAHIQAAVNQHPQVLLCQAAFQPLFPKPVALHGVAVAQVQDPALGLVKPHTIGPSPSIQPVQVPLQSLPTLQQINTPAQLGVICKLTEGALDPFIQIIDKDVKQNWPKHGALGDTTCDRLPTGVNSIHHHSLGPAVQPVLYPAKSTPVQAMSSQFLQENAVGNRVKGFTADR
ncbi:LOW QUALITY PROTEIN: hypothetical protein QYF61_015616 [Mycteria americana]|uniref:Uncharacterized protein n=1 Tax=Mycteria americana TaxID=33587 RepID=A0AAN7NT13_MYCAM|nr:LOW QUALITY PROTEIN: hypothetical protein QYF61_015616 [Mycteria americana]